MPAQEAQAWEEQLNRHLEDCGCSMGAKFAVGGLIGSFIWAIYAHAAGLWSWPHFLLRGLLATFACGIAGKFIGLSLGRLRLASAARQLSRL